ncbi:MAG: 3-methyl-2-oxobutanoate hydroxymethyltransferase, partial [Caulobacterales bacterium]|nr:3-methyl-2-oxobutanoate hydroxymethyltransferase [Caulobacterales bacterium]
MSAQSRTARMTAPAIAARKGGEPIVCLTAYDAPTAALLDEHVDLILVGDSLGMVVHGLPTTVGVTLEMMILHAQAVMRGAERALVVVDLPFGSYEASPETAYESAARVLGETGCQAVKVESGPHIADTARYLVDRGIPVMGHVGLRPQAVNTLGGFKARGRDEAEQTAILKEARAADAAGVFAMVVEGV